MKLPHCSSHSRVNVAPGAWWWIVPGLLLVIAAHLMVPLSPEPVFYGDENRHVMTGVFFRDMLADGPLLNVKEYTESYYVQYPALGLLVWPPLFYGVSGIAMSVFGTYFTTARIVVALFGFLGCVYFYRLVSRTHGRGVATASVVLYSFTPLIFVYSRQVMLELPTLALGLVSTFYFVRYLDELRRRDVFLAAIAAAMAALTRYDAVYLLPMFVFLLLGRGQLAVLRRWDVWTAAVAAVALVAPFYIIAAFEVGAVHQTTVSQSILPWDAGKSWLDTLLYYPMHIPAQAGALFAAAAAIGLVRLRHWERRRENLPYVAMLVATYVTFTAIDEQDIRHTIYWMPALALFAWNGISTLADSRFRVMLRPALMAVVLGTSLSSALTSPRPTLSGYREAAQWTLDHSRDSSRFLFDGWLDGTFTYYVRHLDPERQHMVLRGDKLFYGFVCVPETDFAEYASTDQEILDTIDGCSPEFLVVEHPLALKIPTAERLRDVLENNPDRFELAHEVPVEGSWGTLRGYFLRIYRNLRSRGSVDSAVSFEVRGLKRQLTSSQAGSDDRPDSAH